MRKQVVGAREMVFLISPVRGRRADLTGAVKHHSLTNFLIAIPLSPKTFTK